MKTTTEITHKAPAGVRQSREAIRYLNNAKEILKSVPIEDSTYTDVKYVQEACGTAYLAIIKAIDEVLLKKGVAQKDLPQSVDGYRDMIRKHLSVHNGKLTREFDKLYKLLHIAGYYRGLLEDVAVVKESFKAAKDFIDSLGLASGNLLSSHGEREEEAPAAWLLEGATQAPVIDKIR